MCFNARLIISIPEHKGQFTCLYTHTLVVFLAVDAGDLGVAKELLVPLLGGRGTGGGGGSWRLLRLGKKHSVRNKI